VEGREPRQNDIVTLDAYLLFLEKVAKGDIEMPDASAQTTSETQASSAATAAAVAKINDKTKVAEQASIGGVRPSVEDVGVGEEEEEAPARPPKFKMWRHANPDDIPSALDTDRPRCSARRPSPTASSA